MPRGEINRLHSETSVGTIRETEHDEELFFHAGSLVGETFNRLTEGQAVEFDRQPYRNSEKCRAVNVRLIREQQGPARRGSGTVIGGGSS